ncbi:hypothetical protein D1007_12504 [Hordeum vulgare]|nr:hypothetical protein D1007_12504 [Hordeum vulgare]
MVTSRAARTQGHEMCPEEEDSNWDAPRYGDGLPASAHTQLGDEVAMDDVAFVAVDFDEDDEELRTGVEFQPMESNHFVIKLFSEGDFNFVGRGGPWIYDGNALLVAPFDGDARPSESVLHSVPVWVWVFDVPWKRQAKVYGRAIGGTLGEVIEVDAPDTGHAMNEFLRIRVKLPYNRRLQKEVILEYKAQGVVKRSIFQLKYERVPHFCFHCGFMGHDKLACEKKLLGLPSKAYDSTLRCSPYKKFDHRTAYTPSPGQPRPRRGMSFSFGSVGSANNKDHMRSSGSSKPNEDPEIPRRVDAHDNFELEEAPGSTAADQTLAKEVDKMKLWLEKEKPECSKVQQMAKFFEAKAPATGSPGVSKQRKKKSGVPKKMPEGQRPGNLVIRDAPLGSEDMIPALRGLSSLGSSESASTPMDYHDSVLGKRQVDGMLGFDLVADATNPMVPFVVASSGGVQKKGKVDNHYIDTLLCIKYNTTVDITKGKMAVSYHREPRSKEERKEQVEEPDVSSAKPPPGWTKLNIDGAFNPEQHTGGAGMVLRGEDRQMAAVLEILLETGFPLLLSDSLEKCQVRRMPILLYHEHWVDVDAKEYHVDLIVKANDSPTSWFFEGPQMEDLMLAVETVARDALVRLRDILPKMADELATRHLPFVKDGIDGSWTLNPSSEDGTPLRFQTYFSLSSDTLTHLLIEESTKIPQELHQVKDLLRTEKMKNRKVKKEGAPEGPPDFAFRGGIPPLQATSLQSRRLTAEEYTELFATSPTKRGCDGPLPSPTPSRKGSTDEDKDEDEDEDLAEPAYETA